MPPSGASTCQMTEKTTLAPTYGRAKKKNQTHYSGVAGLKRASYIVVHVVVAHYFRPVVHICHLPCALYSPHIRENKCMDPQGRAEGWIITRLMRRSNSAFLSAQPLDHLRLAYTAGLKFLI